MLPTVSDRLPLVLLVDDEAVLLRMLEINLTVAGYAVRTASSGEGALAAAEADPPDVIVLDLGLPDLEGWEVVARLRGREATAATPVVVLSGTDRDAAGDHDYAATVHAFLTKPVEPAVLVETVRRAVARTDA
jgi:two-component system KDP operon response regulator KdpE